MTRIYSPHLHHNERATIDLVLQKKLNVQKIVSV